MSLEASHKDSAFTSVLICFSSLIHAVIEFSTGYSLVATHTMATLKLCNDGGMGVVLASYLPLGHPSLTGLNHEEFHKVTNSHL